MVPEVALIPNSEINIVTKFQVFVFKNYEVRGGGAFNPPSPILNKLAEGVTYPDMK